MYDDAAEDYVTSYDSGPPDLFFHPGFTHARPLPPPSPPPNFVINHFPDPDRVESSAQVYNFSGASWPVRGGSITQPVHQLPFDRTSSASRPVYSIGVDRTASATQPVYNTGIDRAASGPRQVYTIGVDRTASAAQPCYDNGVIRTESASRQVVSLNAFYNLRVHEPGIPIDWPSLPRKRLDPTKLAESDFKLCHEPWAFSAILQWVREITMDVMDLQRNDILDYVTALFSHKVQRLHWLTAEVLADRVVEEMLAIDALIEENGRLKFGAGKISGVLVQLLGGGCYSSRSHDRETQDRCYSHHCTRSTIYISSPREVRTLPGSVSQQIYAAPELRHSLRFGGAEGGREQSQGVSTISAAVSEASPEQVESSDAWLQTTSSIKAAAQMKGQGESEIVHSEEAVGTIDTTGIQPDFEKDAQTTASRRPSLLKRLYSLSAIKQSSSDFFEPLDYDVLFVMPLLGPQLASGTEEYDAHLDETVAFIMRKLQSAERDLISHRAKFTSFRKGKKTYLKGLQRSIRMELEKTSSCQDRVTTYLDITLRAALLQEVGTLTAKRSSTLQALSIITDRLRSFDFMVEGQLGPSTSSTTKISPLEL